MCGHIATFFSNLDLAAILHAVGTRTTPSRFTPQWRSARPARGPEQALLEGRRRRPSRQV